MTKVVLHKQGVAFFFQVLNHFANTWSCI